MKGACGSNCGENKSRIYKGSHETLSILSKRWKYLWTKISSLDLDEDNMTESSTSQCLDHASYTARRKFVESVDRILQLHCGDTINNFRLSCPTFTPNGFTRRVNSWVRIALTSNIKELELSFGKQPSYNLRRNSERYYPDLYELPQCSFAPRILKALTLNCCKLRATDFMVLPSLQSLYLKYAKVIECSMADVVSKCPVLEYLRLEHCLLPHKFLDSKQDMMIKSLSVINCSSSGLEAFEIDLSTPHLLTLIIEGNYLRQAFIRKATVLLEVTIDLREMYVGDDTLNSVFEGICHCKALKLCAWGIQAFPEGRTVPQKLPVPFQNLKHLILSAGFAGHEVPTIFCFLRSCPNLETLRLNMQSPLECYPAVRSEYLSHLVHEFNNDSNWRLENYSFYCPCPHDGLRRIIITGIIGIRSEMQMVALLLESAVVLEKMVITPSSTNSFSNHTCLLYRHFHEVYNKLRQVLDYPRASANTVIEILRELGLEHA